MITIVTTNYNQLASVYNSALQTYEMTGEGDPYSTASGWFAGKEAPGGAWDYKIQPGYSPWDKIFSCTTYHGVEDENSDWLGNYNYGYVGEYLFSESVLLTASWADGVMSGDTGANETEDENNIRSGYSDAEAYA
ncbi:polymorphic toxin type 44 domain-containing protein [Alicyclobacillus suci]|uniref:polymorphic toxin type 44 domain-containing protein n=1 Tax=Alicyclobacillus suci TaxID=2816080 RepID=UPI001CB79C9E|nr:polymorphic toxin type 44 domain-containing protein [Alicyclobacillus suci]